MVMVFRIDHISITETSPSDTLCHIQDSRLEWVLPFCEGKVGLLFSPIWLGYVQDKNKLWEVREVYIYIYIYICVCVCVCVCCT